MNKLNERQSNGATSMSWWSPYKERPEQKVLVEVFVSEETGPLRLKKTQGR